MVKKLILGTAQLGLNYGINNERGKPSKEEAISILSVAQASGIQFIDTASAYGNSEELIGAFHRISQKQFPVLTKFHAKGDEQIPKVVASALKRLNVPKIEVLFFHSYQDFNANLHMLKDLLVQLKSGRINKIGVSVYTNEEIEHLLEFEDVKVIQAPFNLFDNESKRGEIFERAKALGKEIHTRSVFLQGLFFKDTESLPEKLNPLKPQIQKITGLAQESNLSMASLALNYVLSKDYIDRVLIGVDNEQQLNSNIAALEQTIPQSLIKEIDNIQVSSVELLNPAEWSK